jgi:hypothetical protein
MQACHRLWLRAWSSSKEEGLPVLEEEVEEEGVLAEVMLLLWAELSDFSANSVDIFKYFLMQELLIPCLSTIFLSQFCIKVLLALK